ncbi:MAG: CoA transferase [Pseudomonadota bacterium]
MQPLEGIKVIDLTKLIAGPLCTQYLADLGAQVVKLEDRERGDDLRGMPPFIGTDGAMFFAMNRNKRSVAVDLKTPDGLALALDLLETADVFVESFGAGVAERLGLGQAELRKRFPRLVYCSVSGFGRTGPLATRAGTELMMQAFSGMMLTTGEEGGGPLRIGFSPVDQTTGIHAATGILAALRVRDKTGQGSYVEASLFETATAFMGWHAQSYWITGEVPSRPGSGHESLCPYQAFLATDGHLLIAVGSDLQWRKLCDAIGLPDYSEDPRYRTNAARVANRTDTVALVQGRIGTGDLAHWMAVLAAAGIPASPINTIATAIADPQADARGMVMNYEHPVGGAMKAVAYPVSIEGLPREVHRPPPLHGQHTDEVLREAGCDDAQIARLRASGVVGPAPRG